MSVANTIKQIYDLFEWDWIGYGVPRESDIQSALDRLRARLIAWKQPQLQFDQLPIKLVKQDDQVQVWLYVGDLDE